MISLVYTNILGKYASVGMLSMVLDVVIEYVRMQSKNNIDLKSPAFIFKVEKGSLVFRIVRD